MQVSTIITTPDGKFKPCTECKVVKPLAEFYMVHPTGKKPEIRPRCIDCFKGTIKVFKQGFNKEAGARRYKKYLTARKAHGKVSAALKAGKLVRPKNCSNCGVVEPLEGHHDDYNKPLDVIWLCNPCHKLKHGKLVDPRLLSLISKRKELVS